MDKDFESYNIQIKKENFIVCQKLGEFGFDCHNGNCYIIPSEDNFEGLVTPGSVVMIIGFIVPFIIMAISYGYLWIFMWKSHKYLKENR